MENKSEILNDSCMDLVAVDTTSAAHKTVKSNNTVDFCCAANLPGDFELVNKCDNNAKILYDLKNLSCKIEPKCCHKIGNCPCSSFNIIVIGSIPFIANATVKKGTNQCSTCTDVCPIKISCGCVVPVNLTICNVCSYEAAIKACALLELKLTNCDCVTPMDVKAIQKNEDNSCAVIFTGKFKFPDCM